MNKGEVLLITGGSRGIGAATALLAAAEGYKVAVNYSAGKLHAENVVSEIEKDGGFAIPVQGDVSIESDIEKLFAEVKHKAGPVTGLVNCAGIGRTQCAVSEFSGNVLEHLFRVNVIGTMLCCRNAIRHMLNEQQSPGGAIVNVSSMAATIGGRAGASDYASSKAAVDTFTVGLAKEIGHMGIRVNSVRPGMTLTEMTEDIQKDPDRLKQITSTIPLGRIAHADEVARAIIWLLPDEASFISGARVDVSGGGFHIGQPLGG